MKLLLILPFALAGALVSPSARAECVVDPQFERFSVSCDGDHYAMADTREAAEEIAARRNARGSSMAPVDRDLSPRELYEHGYIGSGYHPERASEDSERAPFSD